MQEGDEDCDDGDDNGDDKTCSENCTLNCGDGVVNGDGEACDDGDDNGDDKTCSENCTLNCGDGVVNGNEEECDNGLDNGQGMACDADCKSNCGDSNLDDGEECDDGKNGDDLDGCTDACTLRFTVFVTSEDYRGDLNSAQDNPDGLSGLDLADLRCQTLANDAEFQGVFQAWLSDSTKSPSDRFKTAPTVENPDGFVGSFQLQDGALVAMGWTGLTSDSDLMSPINLDQTGTLVKMGTVWSNTVANGMAKVEMTEYNCNSWSSSSDMVFGRPGGADYTDSKWTDFNAMFPNPCSNMLHLYCFQVALPPAP